MISPRCFCRQVGAVITCCSVEEPCSKKKNTLGLAFVAAEQLFLNRPVCKDASKRKGKHQM